MTKEEAQQAWKKMRSEIDETNWLFVGTINPQMVDMAIEALQNRPSGKWTNLYEDGHGFWCGTCDHCGKEGDVSMFCPNCGARMYKGGEEYEKYVEQMEHDIMYEPTYNSEDGSM